MKSANAKDDNGMSNADRKRISKQLKDDTVCYVLITCAEPTEDGNMKVEMSYQGDKDLASYLLQGAQNYIDLQEENGEELCPSKVVSLNG